MEHQQTSCSASDQARLNVCRHLVSTLLEYDGTTIEKHWLDGKRELWSAYSHDQHAMEPLKKARIAVGDYVAWMVIETDIDKAADLLMSKTSFDEVISALVSSFTYNLLLPSTRDPFSFPLQYRIYEQEEMIKQLELLMNNLIRLGFAEERGRTSNGSRLFIWTELMREPMSANFHSEWMS